MRVDAHIDIECICFKTRTVWPCIAIMAKSPNRFISMLLQTQLWIILPKGMMQIILKNYRDFWQNVVSSYYFKVVVIDSKSFFFYYIECDLHLINIPWLFLKECYSDLLAFYMSFFISIQHLLTKLTASSYTDWNGSSMNYQ